MIRLFSVILVLCLFVSSGHSIDSLDDDYDCDVPPPLSVEPFTCCKVSKPFDRINFPECFAPPPPPPTSKIYVRSSTFSPPIPIPVSEDFHDDYTPPPTRSSIFKKKFKPAPYQTSTNRPIWPSYYHPDDDRSSSSSSVISDSTYRNDGQDYDKSHKIHYYHHHGDSNSDGDGSSGGSSGGGGRSGGYGHWWPGKYQHWGYHHSSSRHRRGAPNYNINSARTSNLCSIECIFNQTSIITNGRFSRDTALDVYADYYPEIPVDLLTRTVDRCTRQLRNYLIARRRRARNQIKQRNAPVPVNKRCRNGAGLFAACFNREVYRNCPSEIDTISDSCTTLRSFIESCSPIRASRLNFSYDSVDVDENGNYVPQDN